MRVWANRTIDRKVYGAREVRRRLRKDGIEVAGARWSG